MQKEVIAGWSSSPIEAPAPSQSSTVMTRRAVIRAGGGIAATAALASIPTRANAAPQPTAVLVNEAFLHEQYPKEVSGLLGAIKAFAQRENAEVISVDRGASAPRIKERLKRLARRPRRIVIVGEENAIPRFRATWGNGKVYFIRGSQYLRYDLAKDRFEEGYPKAVDAKSWPNWPHSWSSRVRAGVNWDNGKAYFFRDDQYLRYDMGRDRVDDGYPKPITGNWPGFPDSWSAGLDAAVNWGNGKIYLFKGAEYLRYDVGEDKVDKGYPRPLNASTWPNWPVAWKTIDAAAHWGGGTVYFFRGAEYLRYDMNADRILDGYPKPIGGNWPRFPQSWPSVDSVYAFRTGVEIDSFYGDLDGDGFTEAVVCRVLGDPPAMQRQLAPATNATTALRSLSITADPRWHLEASRLMGMLGELGSTAEAQGHPTPQSLAQFDYIHFGGHGNPHGWYRDDQTVISDATVPDLPRQPIIWAGACSTTTPGAPILRAFMNKGCRLYVGASTDSYGWTTGDLSNELLLHFVDALQAHPDWPIAELVGEARNRYVRANGLAALLLQIEKGEVPAGGLERTQTALQWQVFGDITVRVPRAAPHPICARYTLVPRTAMMKNGDALEHQFQVAPSVGLCNVFLRAAWDSDVSKKLSIEIVQNKEVLHRLDWREQREFWAYADISVGGYRDGDRYVAVALVPLIRREGLNTLSIRVHGAAKPIELLPQSGLEAWSKRTGIPAKQALRQSTPNLLWLCRDHGLDPMRNALASIPGLQFERFDGFGDMLAPYEFPDEPDKLLDLSHYDVILLDELPNGYRSFPRGVAVNLRAFVNNGGGLIMAGGPLSYSGKAGDLGVIQGAYGGTPVEDVLPVRIGADDDFVTEATSIGRVEAAHPVMRGLSWSSFPGIAGHNRVAARQRADVLARTRTGDPLIVVWTRGKGRAAALTIESAREFGAEFAKWADYGPFWVNLVQWVSRKL